MKAPRDASHDDYMGEALKDPAEAAAYIEAVLELDEPATLLVALRQVAKAHGMAEVARRANVGDKMLFKALSLQLAANRLDALLPNHSRI